MQLRTGRAWGNAVGGWRQETEVGGQKSEIRGQKTEDREGLLEN